MKLKILFKKKFFLLNIFVIHLEIFPDLVKMSFSNSFKQFINILKKINHDWLDQILFQTCKVNQKDIIDLKLFDSDDEQSTSVISDADLDKNFE